MKSAQIHYDAATQFEQKGDAKSAKDQYAKALVNAKLANGDPSLISMLTYNYGKMLGHTCEYETSVEQLSKALDLEKTITGPNSGTTCMRLFELARLNHDNGYFKKAAGYFDEGIPVIEKLDIISTDPIGYSLLLAVYKKSLDELYRENESKEVQKKIDSLVAKNPGKKPGFTPLSYKCNK